MVLRGSAFLREFTGDSVPFVDAVNTQGVTPTAIKRRQETDRMTAIPNPLHQVATPAGAVLVDGGAHEPMLASTPPQNVFTK
jgi:hypothetical protein